VNLKVTNEASPWHGQDGELIRMDSGSDAPSGPDDVVVVVVVVVRMPGNRAVEFKASELTPVKDEPKADAAE
jgi:hypothetical protein